MHLDGPIDDVVEDGGAVVLDHGDIDPGGGLPFLVHLPGRVQRHQPGRLHLGQRIGHPVLDRLLLGQHGAVGKAGYGPLAQHVEGARRLAQPAHAVVDTTGPEALLGQLEPVAFAPTRFPTGIRTSR